MKKFVFLLATGLFFCIMIFISGCEEPDPIEPVVPPLELSLKVVATPSTITLGETAVIKLTVNNADSTLSDIPGVAYIKGSFEKSVEISPLLTTTYHISSYLNKVRTVKTVTITVKIEVLISPTITTLIATPDSFPTTGGFPIITWTTKNATDVYYKGERYDPNGYLHIFTGVTETIELTAKGPGGQVVRSIVVFVQPPPPPTPDEQLLCNYGPWNMTKLEFQDGPGLPWHEADIWDCMKDDLIYFYLTPTKKLVYDAGEITCSPGEVRISEGQWSLIGNMLNTGSGGPSNKEIITLSQTTLVWEYNTGGNVRETYVHP